MVSQVREGFGAEQSYFAKHPTYGLVAPALKSRLGVPQLSAFLSRVLLQQIKQHLPALMAEVRGAPPSSGPRLPRPHRHPRRRRRPRRHPFATATATTVALATATSLATAAPGERARRADRAKGPRDGAVGAARRGLQVGPAADAARLLLSAASLGPHPTPAPAPTLASSRAPPALAFEHGRLW